MKRAGLFVALIAALVSARPPRAVAGVAHHLGRWLDGDPALAVRLEPRVLADAARLYRKLGPRAARQLLFASAATTGILGFNPLDPAGWTKAGVAGNAPMLVSLRALDTTAARRVVNAKGAAKPPFWRTRAALLVSKPAAADATIARIAKYVPGFHAVTPAEATAVAAVVGAKPAAGHAVIRLLRHAGVRVVGKVAHAVLLFHRHADVLVVDLVQPFHSDIRWRRDRAALARALRQPAAAASLAKRMTSGAATQLARAGATLWLNPGQLINQGSLNVAQPYMSRWRRSSLSRACTKKFGDIARKGAFADAAAHVAIGAHAAKLSVSWALHNTTPAALGWRRADDRVVAPGALIPRGKGKPAVASGALFVSNLDALRSLTAPTAFAHFDIAVLDKALACGSEVQLAVALFGWPHILGAMSRDVGAIVPRARTALANLRNVGFRAERLTSNRSELRGAFAVSMAAPAAPIVFDMLDAVFGNKRRKGALTRWSRGPLQPFAFRQGRFTVAGAGFAKTARLANHAGDSLVRARPARPAKAQGDLGRLTVDLPALLKQLGAANPGLGPFFQRIGGIVGELRGRLVAKGRHLDLRFDVSLK